MTREEPNARLVGAFGVAGFVVPAIGTLLLAPTWDFPATDDSAAAVLAYFVEHRDELLAGIVVDAIGVTLWGIFGMGVWLRLRARGDAYAAACFVFGVIATVTLLMAGFLFGLILAYRGPALADPQMLYDVTFGLLAMSGLPTAVALAAYASITLRTGHLPAWTAVLAVIGAITHLMLLASFSVTSGFFSLEGQVITVIPGTLFIWILGTGVALLRSALDEPVRTV